MGRTDPEKRCINQPPRGEIGDHTLTAMVNLMPERMNAISMAKAFYTLLDAYGMCSKKKTGEVMLVLMAVISQRDKEQKKGDKDDH
jgi:hypothetical protein